MLFIYVSCRVGGSHLAMFLFTYVLQCVLSAFLPTRLTGFQARGGGGGGGVWWGGLKTFMCTCTAALLGCWTARALNTWLSWLVGAWGLNCDEVPFRPLDPQF